MNRLWLHILLALLAGLGLGLGYSWLIAPTQFTDATPAILRADFKSDYRAVVAAAYASNHDLERARSRLVQLGDADPVRALSAQAQQMVAAGDTLENVRNIAQLASDLQQGAVSLPVQSTPTENIVTPVRVTGTSLPNETPIDTPVGEATFTATSGTGTPFLDVTSTPRPTHIPQPLPGKPFALVGQDTVCDTTVPEGLLQVMLMDSHRKQKAGIQIVVTWNGGEDSFYTGFKPEVGDGYADFQMQTGITYSVRVADSGTTVPNVSIPTCTDSNDQTYPGGLLLTFQQP